MPYSAIFISIISQEMEKWKVGEKECHSGYEVIPPFFDRYYEVILHWKESLDGLFSVMISR